MGRILAGKQIWKKMLIRGYSWPKLLFAQILRDPGARETLIIHSDNNRECFSWRATLRFFLQFLFLLQRKMTALLFSTFHITQICSALSSLLKNVHQSLTFDLSVFLHARFWNRTTVCLIASESEPNIWEVMMEDKHNLRIKPSTELSVFSLYHVSGLRFNVGYIYLQRNTQMLRCGTSHLSQKSNMAASTWHDSNK